MKHLLRTLCFTLLLGTVTVYGQKTAEFEFVDTDATFNFGKVKEGVKVEHDFVFKNVGNQPLQIQKVEASCGCTTPDWPKHPILPGKEGKIKVTFNSAGNPGKTIKEISILSNAKLANPHARRQILTLVGEVEKKK